MNVRVLGLVCCVFLYWTDATAQRSIEAIRQDFRNVTGTTVLVAAHRAVHNRYPENSIPAIREGIQVGVDIVEIDVKVSRDGVPFLLHDHTLDRTTTGKGEAEALTWKQLQEFFLVDKGRRTSLKIPSLEEALEAAAGHVLVDLDLKTDNIMPILAIVKKTATEDIVFFFDSDYAMLRRIQRAEDKLMIMPRVHNNAETDSALVFDPPVVHIDFTCYTEQVTQRIRDSFARTWINALGDLDDDLRKGREKRALKTLLEHGANIVQTDEPALLLTILRKNDLHP
ncbi:glycerophosphodiester phosphodiesterase family protein [Fulvivirgaceae bacterium PWU5]|uniref:Glycerophosphodiester phosphodiesterase family protein n=1 Tax=Dawidia cretensis TaxID=2782350 RepID=A0AAP2DWC4_9BACT|nr:glycerophosphodiester phosphodiesterase family protein [Dawidia cretensis]MBT1708608.1 glycerophosphodiester phosphodiesterase family protein [Dawidia cretensis]